MNTDFIDPDRSVCLCRAGLPGWAAAICIGADGTDHPVLVDQAVIGDDRYTYNPDVPHATHEQPGPLPGYWRNRIAALQEWHNILHEAGRMLAAEHRRCGRPTKAGHRCRTPVARPGDACGWHRSAQQ